MIELKDILIKHNIIKVKKDNEELFTLKSGKKSRFFIDIKEASLNPAILNKIIEELHQTVIKLDLQFDIIGSVAIGGIPIASIFSYDTYTPQIIVRSEKHDRGTQTQVIGNCKGKEVILIEDVATTGGSIIKAVHAIWDAGGFCGKCIVVVDREEGAVKECAKENIELISLLKKSDFGIEE